MMAPTAIAAAVDVEDPCTVTAFVVVRAPMLSTNLFLSIVVDFHGCSY